MVSVWILPDRVWSWKVGNKIKVKKRRKTLGSFDPLVSLMQALTHPKHAGLRALLVSYRALAGQSCLSMPGVHDWPNRATAPVSLSSTEHGESSARLPCRALRDARGFLVVWFTLCHTISYPIVLLASCRKLCYNTWLRSIQHRKYMDRCDSGLHTKLHTKVRHCCPHKLSNSLSSIPYLAVHEISVKRKIKKAKNSFYLILIIWKIK